MYIIKYNKNKIHSNVLFCLNYLNDQKKTLKIKKELC